MVIEICVVVVGCGNCVGGECGCCSCVCSSAHRNERSDDHEHGVSVHLGRGELLPIIALSVRRGRSQCRRWEGEGREKEKTKGRKKKEKKGMGMGKSKRKRKWKCSGESWMGLILREGVLTKCSDPLMHFYHGRTARKNGHQGAVEGGIRQIPTMGNSILPNMLIAGGGGLCP